MPNPVTFVVSGVPAGTRGVAEATPVVPSGVKAKASILLTAQRGAAGDLRIEATPDEDAVVIHIANGPSLWLHPEHARELLQAQTDPASDRGEAPEPLGDGEIRVPPRLQWRLEQSVPTRGASRGFLGDVIVRAIDIVTGFAKDKAADVAASKVVNHFDSRVTEGVYRLSPERLKPLKGRSPVSVSASDGSSLILVHGTFSETSGTFGKLWSEHSDLVRSLFDAYGGRVYGLDHPTLGSSPIANAIALANALPQNARVHLLTHSRGGLVAEVLARVAAQSNDHFAPFKADEYAAQRKELQRLAKLVSDKGIRVDRIVRVGCPARGTLLASNRLDAYVSVVKWSLELAQVPVADELVDFLGEVARRRADPALLPGLAAQIPDSPLVQWLHSAPTAIAGDLRVVAGDLQGDSVISWVKTLLSDSFFWTDNDLVVQTRSMYGGTPRATSSTFVLDQGGNVSHFNYFSNDVTANAIVGALTQKDPPAAFRVIGPLSWGGTSSTGTRAALMARSAAAAAELPALFVLPGILGSNLKIGDDRIWLGWRLINGLDRLAYVPGKKNVSPDGPIGLFYDDVAAYLWEDHDVMPFAFDWRRPIEDEAKRLANAVDAALDAREKSGKPVRMLAHSMGGIVARTMQFTAKDTWARLMANDGARILMLGTPNGGSWSPMQVLSGDDTFGNLLTTVGAPFRGNETRRLIAQFPGLLQLQADLVGELGTPKKWKELADKDLAVVRRQGFWHNLKLQLNEFEWGIPTKEVLDQAVALRKRLDRQRDQDLAQFAGKLLLVVGKSAFTATAYDFAAEGLVYLGGPDLGDGTVPLQSAILPGVDTWTLDCEHGVLPKQKDAFDAFRDLLNTGTTKRLPRLSMARAAREDVAALVPSRPSRSLVRERPPERETEVLRSPSQSGSPAAIATPGAGLRISVVNGDLTYISDALLIGHYRSLRLTGAEEFMDGAIGGTMSASLQRGLYPSEPGSHQIFVNRQQSSQNPWQLPRPESRDRRWTGS